MQGLSPWVIRHPSPVFIQGPTDKAQNPGLVPGCRGVAWVAGQVISSEAVSTLTG